MNYTPLEAMAWDGSRASAEALCRWLNDRLPTDEDPLVTYTFEGTDDVLDVSLFDANRNDFTEVLAGDWIIRGEDGACLVRQVYGGRSPDHEYIDAALGNVPVTFDLTRGDPMACSFCGEPMRVGGHDCNDWSDGNSHSDALSVGDRVVVSIPDSIWNGKAGTLSERACAGDCSETYRVEFDDADLHSNTFGIDELRTLAEQDRIEAFVLPLAARSKTSE